MLGGCCVFVCLICLVSGQFQFSLLTSLQPPPDPFPILQPPPPPPPPPPPSPQIHPPVSPFNLALAPRRTPVFDPVKLTVLSPPPLPSSTHLFNVPQGQFTASPPEVSGGFTGISGPRTDLSSEIVLSREETAPPLAEISESFTSLPDAASSPTTIRFTLDDVHNSFQPSVFPLRDASLQEEMSLESNVASLEAASLSLEAEDDILLASSAAKTDLSSESLLLTLGRTSTAPPQTIVRGKSLGDETLQSPLVSSLEVDGDGFKPSLHFPFLLDSTEAPQNEFTLVEERKPRVSFLRPEPSHAFDSSSNTFILKPVIIVSKNDTAEEERQFVVVPSKTPVPTKVDMSEGSTTTTPPKTTKPPPTRKTLHFNQEFLSLLRTAAAEKNGKGQISSSPRPFWLSVPKGDGALRLIGGEGTLPSTLAKTTPVAARTAGGFFAKSIKRLTSAAAIDALNVGLSLSTDNANATSELQGPTVVTVGEVGEVSHDLEAAHAHNVPATLSAALKHGVQTLNVSARASGCPKLYGKVELTCSVDHDGPNSAMKMMWKKKSFLQGRPEEQIVSEDSVLRLEDARLSLKRRPDAYTLVIKDFRPKDCGTYECEVQAADAKAASQLLLFTCL